MSKVTETPAHCYFLDYAIFIHIGLVRTAHASIIVFMNTLYDKINKTALFRKAAVL